MATLTFEAGGREITLRYTVSVIAQAEEAYGSMDKLQQAMQGDDKPTAASLDLIAWMANAHERHTGKKDFFTREWLKKHLTPRQVSEAKIMTQYAIMVGMRRDVEEDEDIEVDTVLKEIEEERKKKRAQALQEAATNLPAN